MRIRQVAVKNFRSIRDATLDLDALTVLVGRNGAGKSSFLSALDLFYDPQPQLAEDDFHAGDLSDEMEIAVTFDNLNPEEQELFAPYIDGDTLTVKRVFVSGPQGPRGTFHGASLQNPDFAEVRQMSGAQERRKRYNELRATQKYKALPTITSAAAAEAEMVKWEAENPSQSRRLRDDGQFFGFTQVGAGYLGRHTTFIHVPAVRDATEDAAEQRGSPITALMDLAVRGALSNQPAVADFRERTQLEYAKLMTDATSNELEALQNDLSDALAAFAPGAAVSLRQASLSEIDIPMPRADVRLAEDNYTTTVSRTGHGLQRAFILTLLQHLAKTRAAKADLATPDSAPSGDPDGSAHPTSLPSLILAIDEPELYLHPSRQRHLASVLLDLAEGAMPAVAPQVQVIYTTHSPLFVGLDRFDQIRVLRKGTEGDDKPKTTHVVAADMTTVAAELQEARKAPERRFTSATLKARLQAIMTPVVNEGFFADVAVLVEGEGDRGAILGAADSLGVNLDSLGVAVISCGSKSNLDRPLVILRKFGIAVYVLWDSDAEERGAKPESNKYLLRLLEEEEEPWPEFVRSTAACFKQNLEKTLRVEIGETLFDELLTNIKEDLDMVGDPGAAKRPVVLRRIVERAAKQGHPSTSLEAIVTNVVKLVNAV